MPGLISWARRSKHPRTTLPARAIFSISACDFLIITSPLLSVASTRRRLHVARRAQRRTDVLVHRVGCLGAVDAGHHPGPVVVRDERLGLIAVDLQPVAHRGLSVVVALVELAAALVAHALLLRRVEQHVERRLADAADAASGEPAHQILFVHQDHEGLGDPPVQAVQDLVQGLRLGDGAREPVHQEALGRVGLLQTVLDDADHHAVGDQLARVHELLGLQPHLSLVLDRRAQDVARGDVGDAVLGHDAARLRAFARAGRSEQDEVELSHATCLSLSWPGTT